MADASDPLLTPGNRVTVIQQTPRLGGVWTSRTTGTVVRSGQARTTWPFAHARHDRLWLDRLWLRKDDGEIDVLNLDQYTRIEPAPPGSAAPGSGAPGSGAPGSGAPGSASPGSAAPAGSESDAGASSETATPAPGGSAPPADGGGTDPAAKQPS